MKLKQLTSAEVKELAKLVQEKEELQEKVSEIERKIQTLWKVGIKVPKKRIEKIRVSVKKRGPEKGSIPGHLKNSILEALRKAGNEGLTVKELSEKLGVKINNLYSWFYTTGKKTPGLIKIGKSKYRIEESTVEPEALQKSEKDEKIKNQK
ncbi:hypothetical protein A7K93_02095 [Candidatus Methylacidiphilum fumarolicum]|uniref:Uncharacterized protein n=2 Tax=Candidatus Methylacidiphilum fumarolicum TaxID=591154 RepID=I0K0U2_METFB|nr:hypothetical protein [Candidatus Methylacidiphilum fumarolicum]MBW6414014.1 hypothetical protein [Candidatus Methylacidiphilum fumarolicum]TFE66365.1 hypothetical protein A7K73_01245 [Candidatus Methylacidiphilum fumarolicum]TFE75295.1 hypothetical protein A7K93_02095 [Candidatus Methylacidiphilum fumarolicum]TFE76093.1 hypothetical protein A7K72_00080 [Candidatus Methylacidiphilum fumarolicum]TFE77236.1 hypothetical protein A7D33_05355 [Candidatus Methylacidiphilum fumarolicum]